MTKKLIIGFSTLSGIILIFVLFRLTGPTRVLVEIKELGLVGTAVFIINSLLILLIAGFSWQIILRSYGYRLPFRDVLGIKIVAFAISYLTPSMYIGGEPARIYLLCKKHCLSTTTVTATVVVDKFLELGAGLLYVFVGSIWALMEPGLPLQIYLILIVLNSLFALGMILLLISFVFQTRSFTYVINFLERIKVLAPLMRKLKPQAAKLEEEIFPAFKRHRRQTILAFGLNLLTGYLVFIKPAIFFYFLKVIFSLSQLALLFALTHLLLAFQFTPGALGIFELGEVGIYQLVGIGSEGALAFSLMVRLADLVGVVIASYVAISVGITFLREKKKI